MRSRCRTSSPSLLLLVMALATAACGGRDMTEDGPGSGSGGSGGGGGASGAAGFNQFSGSFDSGRVYFSNRVDTCLDAVSPVETPDTIAYGFACNGTDHNTFHIDPFSSDLVYVGTRFDSDPESEVLEWVADSPSVVLGQDLNGNDIESTAPCPDNTASIETPVDIRFSPSGAFYYHCMEGGIDRGWFDGSAMLYYLGTSDLLAVTDTGLALLRGNFGLLYVYDPSGPTETEVTGLVGIQAVRGLANGFWVTVPDAAGDELWEIDAAASATLVDTYPTFPAGFDPDEAVLDDTGQLHVLGDDDTSGLEAVILRAPMGGSGWTELYREDIAVADPRVDPLEPGRTYLFTGP